MFEVFLAVAAFGLGLWLGWSAGVEHGEERILKGSSRSHGSNFAAVRASQSQAEGWGQFRKQAVVLAQDREDSPRAPSEKLAALIGPEPITTAEAYNKVLAYAEANNVPMCTDGSMGFDGPMRLAFVAPWAHPIGLASLIDRQLSAPVQEEGTSSERAEVK